MGYLHISNLYKDQDILMFKECFALEKIHGTSAHLEWKQNPSNPAQRQLVFFSGGTSYNLFVSLFDQEKLTAAFTTICPPDKDMTVYGESYGGKEQGMSETYGKTPKFVVFDVQIGDNWLSVPDAENICKGLGLEFVHYEKVSTDLKSLDEQRDLPSMQAIRNGISQMYPTTSITPPEVLANTGPMDVIGRWGAWVINPRKREGVVLRPLIELTKNNNARIICKHKGDNFKETKSPRPVVDPAKMQVLNDAEAIATEWVTPMRLQHVLDKLPGHSIEKMRAIIAAMVEDVEREGTGEFIPSEAVKKAIGKKTALAYKEYLHSKLNGTL